MNLTGRIKEINKDWISGKTYLSLEINQEPTEEFAKLSTLEQLDIRIKKISQKRSLDANGFYWSLLTQLANKLRVSKPRMHNLMLRRYGVAEMINGMLVQVEIPDTDEATEKVAEEENFHLKPTSQVRESKNGQTYRTHVLLKGTSQFNTEEMHHLINGLVDECKTQGIETATPDEIRKMMELYGEMHSENDNAKT